MGTAIAILVTLFTGLIGGGLLTFLGMWAWRSRVATQAAQSREQSESAEKQRKTNEADRQRLQGVDAQLRELQTSLLRKEEAFKARAITYEDLRRENELCKRDLRNIEMSVRKSRMDTEQLALRQQENDTRSQELASRYLKENVKHIGNSVTSRNYTALKQRLLDVIERCRKIGFAIASQEEAQLLRDLQQEFELAVRAEMEREEQARIRARIREEERVQRELEKEIKQAEREKEAVQAALDQALALAKEGAESNGFEIQQLRAKLADAELRSERAKSRAQLTRSGHVYIISNLGSFGDDVFKIGMTRRAEPKDRVIELGGASVPFPFDIHMVIFSEDAPALENMLHRALHRKRVNRVNPRKEFFKVSLSEIAGFVTQHHGTVEYIADMEALEFRQSQQMSDEDAQVIEQAFDYEDEETEPSLDGI